MLLPEMLLNSTLTFAATPSILAANEKNNDQRSNRCAEVCAVCGDFSTGYHYEVPSCNGCKTFFRRTIVSERVFKCHKNGNCLFNKDIRCACRACRFKKCLEVGMNPKAIQCSRPPMMPFQPSSSSASTSPKSSSQSVSLGIASQSAVDTTLPLRKRAYDISSLLGMSPTTSQMAELGEVKVKPELSDSHSEYGSSSGSPRPSKTPKLEQDQSIISSLLIYENRADFLRTSDFEASGSLLDSLTKPCGLDDVSKYVPQTTEVSRTMTEWMDLEITICIEYAKAFEAFRNLSIADKCVLIDDTCVPLALLSLALATHLKGLPGVQTPDGQPVEYENLPSDFFSSRIRGPLDRISVDRTSFALLKCIIFLHAECSALSDAGRIALTARREKYYEALNAHVFATQGSKAPSQMCDLVALAWTLFQVAAKVRDCVPQGTSLHRQVIDTSAVWRVR